jgi:signal transduction histidine kinase
MSLRLKLLLISLFTLALPWAGCHYAREMESVLREGEKQSLGAVAQTIAASLQGRSDYLYRSSSNEVFSSLGPYDLLPVPLPGQPYIDGFSEEWPQEEPPVPYRYPGARESGDNAKPASPQPAAVAKWKYFDQPPDRLGVLTGVHERMLYVLLDVKDQKVVFDASASDPLDPAGSGDRVWIGFEDFEGAERQVFLSATGPGTVRARRIEAREYGRQVAVDEERIQAAWRLVPSGYQIELQIPLSMLGNRLGVLVDDRDARGALASSYGTLRGDDLHTRGRLVTASPELSAYLAQFIQPGLRLTVTTPKGGVLAAADGLALPTELNPDRGLLARIYRRLLDRPGERRMLESEGSIYDHDHQHVIGILRVTQTVDRWLTLRDQALTTLLNFTLTISLVAVLIMFVFAARLALRLSRLRRASETALTREGLVTTFPETQAPDELGDVARSFSTLLHRLNEYTGYLRTLAGKLAHGIRTPLTIVRSSLENIESEGTAPPAARVYLERAREGSERLNAILVAMGAATRVEEAIQGADRTRFDLVPVIASAVASYRIGFPERVFSVELPAEPVFLEGAPDLIVQLLDKLVDNAVDFSPPGSTITVRLRMEPDAAVMEVDNVGPPLPAEAQGRLFESLWQSRTGGDSRPHFGLGLYIVRLIAEFHGGRADAVDLPEGTGVRFAVRLKV